MTERPTEQTHPRLNGLEASSTAAPTLPPMPGAPESDRPEYRPQTSEPARPSLAERLQQKVTVRQAERPAERLDSTSVRPAVQASTAAPTAPAPTAPTGEDRPVLPPPAADQAPPQPAPAPAKKRPARASRPKRPPRRARLRLTRIDPWSVMKTAFLLSIALGVVTIVSVLMVWSVLGAAGVWDSINTTVRDIVGEQASTPFTIQNYLGTDRVIGFTMLVAVIDVVLLTAIATLSAFLYNMAAALLGGIDITLVEDEH
jgi:hypothetical protein